MQSEIPVLPGPERRSELRRTCNNAPAELTIVDSGATSVTTIPAVIIEISRSGLRVVANTRTIRGQQVRLRMDKLIIFGEVRHCRAQGANFESGVEISNVVGHRGHCDRLTDEQIELLALDGRGLSAGERMYAYFHVSHCSSCDEQLQATRHFYANIHSVSESDVEPPLTQSRS